MIRSANSESLYVGASQSRAIVGSLMSGLWVEGARAGAVLGRRLVAVGCPAAGGAGWLQVMDFMLGTQAAAAISLGC
eukprot:COSAG01_NODE_1017_length_12107_cov_114.566372_7_plen_77_part_00